MYFDVFLGTLLLNMKAILRQNRVFCRTPSNYQSPLLQSAIVVWVVVMNRFGKVCKCCC